MSKNYRHQQPVDNRITIRAIIKTSNRIAIKSFISGFTDYLIIEWVPSSDY